MASTHPTRGHTLAEMAVVLLLLGLALASWGSLFGHLRDTWSVETARRLAAEAFHRTRATAVATGGATLRVDTAGGHFTLADGVEERLLQALGPELGVRTRLGGAPTREFRYDAAGIGRVANATLTFRRRRAEARLVVSLFGRVRP